MDTELNLSNIDPNTGEIVDYQAPDDLALEHAPEDPLDKWGEYARTLLEAIDYEASGRWWRKKRATLLHLADAAYLGRTKTSVFKLFETGSVTAYYKWLNNDSAFREAHDHLVGPIANGKQLSEQAADNGTGIAHQQREVMLDEHESVALSALIEAKGLLRMHSADAVRTLVDALHSADIRQHPQWRERIMAANAILDRGDSETASRAQPALQQINQAIMMIYNEGGDDEGTADEEADVIEGDIESPADSIPYAIDQARDDALLTRKEASLFTLGTETAGQEASKQGTQSKAKRENGQ
jgi:hypothetical protein